MPTNSRRRRIDAAQVINTLLEFKGANTTRAYWGDLEKFAECFGASNATAALDEVLSSGAKRATSAVEKFKAQVSSTTAASSASRSVSVIRSFIHTAFALGMIDWTVSVRPYVAADRKMQRREITYEQLARVQQALAQDRSVAGIRNRAVFALALNNGILPCELAALKVGSVDLRRSVIAVSARGTGVVELLPLGQTTVAALGDWLSVRTGYPEDLLFVQLISKETKSLKLSTAGIYDIIDWCGKRAGLRQHICPRDLRRAWLKTIVGYTRRSGMPLTEAMRLSRHRKRESLVVHIDRTGGFSRDILRGITRERTHYPAR
jgi:integrase